MDKQLENEPIPSEIVKGMCIDYNADQIVIFLIDREGKTLDVTANGKTEEDAVDAMAFGRTVVNMIMALKDRVNDLDTDIKNCK